MRTRDEELTRLVRDAIKELGLKEEPHPQLRPGEVFIGEIEYTADREGKEHEAYSSSNLTVVVGMLHSSRIGEREDPLSENPTYDYSRPVFVEQTEYYAYLMAMTEGS